MGESADITVGRVMGGRMSGSVAKLNPRVITVSAMNPAAGAESLSSGVVRLWKQIEIAVRQKSGDQTFRITSVYGPKNQPTDITFVSKVPIAHVIDGIQEMLPTYGARVIGSSESAVKQESLIEVVERLTRSPLEIAARQVTGPNTTTESGLGS